MSTSRRYENSVEVESFEVPDVPPTITDLLSEVDPSHIATAVALAVQIAARKDDIAAARSEVAPSNSAHAFVSVMDDAVQAAVET